MQNPFLDIVLHKTYRPTPLGQMEKKAIKVHKRHLSLKQIDKVSIASQKGALSRYTMTFTHADPPLRVKVVGYSTP